MDCAKQNSVINNFLDTPSIKHEPLHLIFHVSTQPHSKDLNHQLPKQIPLKSSITLPRESEHAAQGSSEKYYNSPYYSRGGSHLREDSLLESAWTGRSPSDIAEAAFHDKNEQRTSSLPSLSVHVEIIK